jgi:hypothetical protein
MDEMKIGSKFMKNAISSMVKTLLLKKVGYDVDIQLNELEVSNTDERTHVHMNVDAEVKRDELVKIFKFIGL